MGNCCATPNGAEKRPKQKKNQKEKKQKGKKPNPFSIEYNKAPNPGYPQITVLKDPTGRDISRHYELGRELGRGEFGINLLFGYYTPFSYYLFSTSC